jgi:hypothetical protein
VKARVKNLWTMSGSSVFDLVLGLKVNFLKRNFFLGANVDRGFLQTTSKFLYCRIEPLPFIYFGLPLTS